MDPTTDTIAEPALDEDENKVFLRLSPFLRDAGGRSYEDFRATLRPNYFVAWANIAAGYASLLAIIATVYLIEPPLGWDASVRNLLLFMGLGVFIGYVFAFLFLWLHEASHFNLHPDKTANDLLANLVLGLLLIQDVRKYRRIHNQHHAWLGMTNDTERSYFNALDLAFFLKGLSGYLPIKTLLFRNTELHRENDTFYIGLWSVLGVLFHATVAALLILTNQYLLVLAWAIGVIIIFPFLAALRQLLEHRSVTAKSAVDFSQTPHGAYSRVFGAGPLASTFGGAGFNRHLIHHWDPSLPCNCFAEAEKFLKNSQLAVYYESRETTYFKTFKSLLHSAYARADQ